jgi:serine/threonine protein kinase
MDDSKNLQDLIKSTNLDFKRRYIDLKLIGEGGGGKVYRALDQKLNKEVALKVLRSAVDSRDIVRFQQEAKILSRLNNQFIVRVLDFEHSDDDEFYIVMEFVDGSMVENLLKKSGPFPLEDSIRYAVQLCSALEHAHSQGVVHRDLKPSNVMIDSRKNVRILDFGIAKLLHDQFETLTRPNAAIGTPMYMSPEQVRAEGTDERTDIYGLGLLLYMMLTGRTPFDTDQMIVSFQQRLNDEPPPHLRLYVGETETAHSLNDIVRMALKSDPDARFQSMEDFREALLALLTEAEVRQITAHGTSAAIPRKKAIGFIAVSLILTALSLGFLYNMYRKDATERFLGKAPKVNVSPAKNPFRAGVYSEAVNPLPRGFHPDKQDKKLADYWFADDDLTDSRLMEVLNANEDVTLISLHGAGAITADGIRYVTQLDRITGLDLSETVVTDELLKDVGRMPNLVWLKLASTGISDRGIKNLEPLRGRLERLDIDACKKVTDIGFQSILHNQPNLEYLHIGDTSITPASVRQVRNLTNVISLWVPSLKLRDDDVDAFRNLRLRYLDLTNNHHLTDRVLTIIGDMPLSTLEAINCEKLTDSAISAFRKSHRSCNTMIQNKRARDEFTNSGLLEMDERISD